MRGSDVAELLTRACTDLGVRDVAFRCECENLESVYLVLDADGVVRATDHGETFEYLSRAAPTYVDLRALDLAAVKAICSRHGVALVEADESYPRIERVVEATEAARDVVSAVGDAIDAVFASALRR